VIFQGFVLQHQVILFCLGETFTEQLPIYPPVDLPVNTRANAADFGGTSVPKPGLEVNLGLCLPINLYASIMRNAKLS
jgi:protein CLEC16A